MAPPTISGSYGAVRRPLIPLFIVAAVSGYYSFQVTRLFWTTDVVRASELPSVPGPAEPALIALPFVALGLSAWMSGRRGPSLVLATAAAAAVMIVVAQSGQSFYLVAPAVGGIVALRTARAGVYVYRAMLVLGLSAVTLVHFYLHPIAGIVAVAALAWGEELATGRRPGFGLGTALIVGGTGLGGFVGAWLAFSSGTLEATGDYYAAAAFLFGWVLGGAFVGLVGGIAILMRLRRRLAPPPGPLTELMPVEPAPPEPAPEPEAPAPAWPRWVDGDPWSTPREE